MHSNALLASQGISTLFLIVFGIYGLVGLTILAQVVPELHLLEIIVSLLPQILIMGVLATLALSFHDKRIAMIGAVLTLVASLPFLTLSKFESPTGSTCQPDECLTIMTINIWSESEFLPALSYVVDDYQLDLLAINEATEISANAVYGNYFFPRFDAAIHATWLNMPRGMGNPISLFSRIDIADFERVLRKDTGRRAYIAAELDDGWEGTRIVVAHAMTPVTPSGLVQRNALIRAGTKAAERSESYIFLGDFNLTPWSSIFRELPGKRAGDPRFSKTWPSQLPLLGMSIDHIMFSDDLELVEFEILGSIGSDHYPVMAKFKRKDR